MDIPKATYRIQFTPDFNFIKAKDIFSYLSDLRISTIYASPITAARKGSAHGYDVIDYEKINPELGSEQNFNDLIEEAKKYSLSWLQDFVPNHMAFCHENLILMDILKHGAGSRYADFFDIEWDHPYQSLKKKLLVPFLGSFYAEALEQGQIHLVYENGELFVSYYDHRFPLMVKTYHRVFSECISSSGQAAAKSDPDYGRIIEIISLLKDDNPQIHESARKDLFCLYNSNKNMADLVSFVIDGFNGNAGQPQTFDKLDELISMQEFRLSFWKVATEEINYRRFFAVNDLISLNIDSDKVFDYAHSLVFRLISEGKIQGLRLDHIDGLYDPKRYLNRLRQKTPDAYIVVEKILAHNEKLPADWPVMGTTGYEFLNCLNGIFCLRANRREFIKTYYKFIGLSVSFEELAADKKRLIIGKHMAGDIDNLAHLLMRAAGFDRYGKDITLYGLKRALVEVMVYFPVYRTYVNSLPASGKDREYILAAVDKARASLPGMAYEIGFIEKFLLSGNGGLLGESEKRQILHFIMRFQQFSGPVTAKGFEDTVLYIYNKLISLNEVGSEPDRFGTSIKDFHINNLERQTKAPHCLSATSTHDTKRGEDVRARINVLSELPGEWRRNLKLWSALNAAKKKRKNGRFIPEANDEYFFYQTLIGTWPFGSFDRDIFLKRISEYMVKAVREAKVHTAWIKPDSDYEEACVSFVDSCLSADGNRFLESFVSFSRKISFYGIFNSLSQVILKIASPGVPDFYQGSELWDLSLVDPDNRRPADFSLRASFLRQIKDRVKADNLGLIDELLNLRNDGRIKLFCIYKALSIRMDFYKLFSQGSYIPLKTGGRHRSSLVCFARELSGKNRCIVIVPRFLTSVSAENQLPLGQDIWQDTYIDLPWPAKDICLREAFSGQEIICSGKIMAAEAFKYFPGAILVNTNIHELKNELPRIS